MSPEATDDDASTNVHINPNSNSYNDSDDTDAADPELVALLREKFQSNQSNAHNRTTSNNPDPDPSTQPANTNSSLAAINTVTTDVLASASFICDNSIDIALSPQGTKAAAAEIWSTMQKRSYDRSAWSAHELHPQRDWAADEKASFVFAMDLLNFSFWSEREDEDRFAIEYEGKRYTGYLSLVAGLRRALDEEIPMTTPSFWRDEEAFDMEKFEYIFRSASDETMPLLEERLRILREAGAVLEKRFNDSIPALIEQANHSAVCLVNTLAEYFQCFRDEAQFEERTVRFLKRAQIFVADLWGAFDGEGYGNFRDIDSITMFADYRVPQMLVEFGCMSYSPPLETAIRRRQEIKAGSNWEIQLRGCSIWSVELIRREIKRLHPEAEVNAILIDFFLYDNMKEKEKAGEESIPHHRTRSIWY